MDAIAQWALTSLSTYGLPMLLFIAFIGSLGIPFPITMVIVAAGAFARAGLLDWRLQRRKRPGTRWRAAND